MVHIISCAMIVMLVIMGISCRPQIIMHIFSAPAAVRFLDASTKYSQALSHKSANMRASRSRHPRSRLKRRGPEEPDSVGLRFIPGGFLAWS